jgi:hypothetical protein
VFQLILPFQLELPFEPAEAGAANPRRARAAGPVAAGNGQESPHAAPRLRGRRSAGARE